MINEPPDYLRTVHTAAWTWLAYLLILIVLDITVYTGSPSTSVLWYHTVNFFPALLFLCITYSKWVKNGSINAFLLMILLISIIPILVNILCDLQLPPAPLTNLEGTVLRQLPFLLIGLALVAWRYSLSIMVLYSLVINGFELSLLLLLHRLDDPRYAAFFMLVIIRTACFVVVGIFINQLISHLRVQAMRDSLTGLYNRHYLNEFLNHYIARARREKMVITLVLMDIDYFKRFNDTYGHLAGDAMLRAVGKLLEKNTRLGDIACRFGGEEFLWVMPGASLDDAFTRTDQLRRALENFSITFGEKRLQVTFSAGVAAFPLNGSTLEAVMSVADDTLYAAKQAGRNCVVCSTYRVTQENRAIIDALHHTTAHPES
jgi:diguanylate cyclase (GGDEF)-like protein